MSSFFYLLLAVLAGMTIATQGVVNGKLAESVGSPFLAAFISFAVGTIVLFVYILIAGIPLGNLASAGSAPLVAWGGGFLGAFFVSVMTTTVPRLGVALVLSLAVGGQMLAAILIDHFGWLGIPEKPVSAWRVAGAALIIVGVILIRRF